MIERYTVCLRALTIVAFAAASGCRDQAPPPPTDRAQAPTTAPDTLTVQLKAAPGRPIAGQARFRAVEGGGVEINVDVQNAMAGLHAVHIHENAECAPPDFKSAGEHFNPNGEPHGLPDEERHHLGDLGNIEIEANGRGKLQITVPNANLKPGDKHSFLGRALIVHAEKDTGVQPAGGAGGRIACAEIVPG